MNRRDFLKSLLIGTSGILVGLKYPSIISSAQEIPDSEEMADLFDAFVTLVGLNSTSRLTRTSQARQERERINNIMAASGFTLTPEGEIYEDYEDVRQLPKYKRRDNGRIDIETYVVAHENGVDICAPFYSSYEGGRKPVMESIQIFGALSTVLEYKEFRSTTSTSHLRDMFIPRGYVTNPGALALLETPVRTAGEYETENGQLNIYSTPTRNGQQGEVSVEVRGRIDFDRTFPFDFI